MISNTQLTTIWLITITIRLILALNINYTSYIHPDEHFQCPEVALQWEWSKQGITTKIPWEYNTSTLFRSTIAPTLQCRIPFKLLKWIIYPTVTNNNISGQILLLTIRLWSFFLSIINDGIAYMIFKQITNNNINESLLMLITRSTSWVSLVLLIRPFSNSLETLALDILLCLALYVKKIRPSTRYIAICGGSILCLGCFIRITFPAFALPIVCYVIWEMKEKIQTEWHKKKELHHSTVMMMKSVTQFILWCALGFICCAMACISIDSSVQGSLVLAPWNNLLYNTNSNNLAEHGLHPRWTHVLVNMQIMFGPLLFVVLSVGISHQHYSNAIQLCIGIIISSLVILSIFPHQEPRFLAPLLVPCVATVIHLLGKTHIHHGNKRYLLIVIWIIFNIISTIFWGILHQGGVIDGILTVAMENTKKYHQLTDPHIEEKNKVCLFGMGIYSIPKYLFGIGPANGVEIMDIGSGYSTIDNLNKYNCNKTYIITTSEIWFKELGVTNDNIPYSILGKHKLHFNGEHFTGTKDDGLIVIDI
jgi:phosphatidylinositol glycan class Z